MKLTTANQLLTESINDKNIFKAVFLVGAPGSGKSHFVKQVTDGSWGAKLINPDKFVEFLAKTRNVDISEPKDGGYFNDDLRRIRVSEITNYINSMLPVFIDGTGTNVQRTLRRVDIMESFGYDTYIVWVSTDIDTAIINAALRVKKTGRSVPLDFIERSYKTLAQQYETYKKDFGQDFFYYENHLIRPEEEHELMDMLDADASGKDIDEDRLDELANKFRKAQDTKARLEEAHKALDGFFRRPVKNHRAKTFERKIEAHKAKYLCPTVFDIEYIQKVIRQNW